jgi:GT2 family glycosyltransferase
VPGFVRSTLAIVPTFLRRQEELDVVLWCLVSLRQTAPDATVLVVDDHSPEAELARLVELACDELGAAFVRADANAGFATTVNVGLELALANEMDAVLVNADVEFPEPGWLNRMRARTDSAGRPAAVVGARLLYPNGLLQHAGIYFSALHRGFGHRFLHGPADLPEALAPARCPVTAALQLVRWETLASVGLYDESFGMAFEDVDYCLRVFEAGLECIYEPSALAIHHEQYFRGRRSKRTDEMHARSNARLLEKHATTDLGAWTPTAL